MSNFEDKKKMLFECLNSAEKCIEGTSLEQKRFDRDDKTSRKCPPAIGRRFHGKESIFKRPEAPIGKCLRPRRVPDYQVFCSALKRSAFEKKSNASTHLILDKSAQMEKIFTR